MTVTTDTEMHLTLCRWISSGLLSGITSRFSVAGKKLLHEQDYLLEIPPQWGSDGISETVNHYGCEMIQGVEAYRDDLFAQNTKESIWRARALPQWFGRLNTNKDLSVYQKFQLTKNHDYWRKILQSKHIAGGAFYEFSAPFINNLTSELIYQYDDTCSLTQLESTPLQAIPNIRICLGKWTPAQIVEWAKTVSILAKGRNNGTL